MYVICTPLITKTQPATLYREKQVRGDLCALHIGPWPEIKPFVPCHPTQKREKNNVSKARYDATRRLIGGIIGRGMVLDSARRKHNVKKITRAVLSQIQVPRAFPKSDR